MIASPTTRTFRSLTDVRSTIEVVENGSRRINRSTTCKDNFYPLVLAELHFFFEKFVPVFPSFSVDIRSSHRQSFKTVPAEENFIDYLQRIQYVHSHHIGEIRPARAFVDMSIHGKTHNQSSSMLFGVFQMPDMPIMQNIEYTTTQHCSQDTGLRSGKWDL